MTGDAYFSVCGRYRYWLTRVWDRALPRVCFVMLNPSIAGADNPDPTMRRCLGFAKDLGFGSLEIVNLFALVSTDPAALRLADDPVGPENDDCIRAAVKRAAMAICAWGTKSPIPWRAPYVFNILKVMSVQPVALRVTKGRHPSHPLYLPAGLQPTNFFGHYV